MTGPTKYASQHRISCGICSRPVPLEVTKTNENGKAVHEECYVRQTISRFKAPGSKANRSPGSFASLDAPRESVQRVDQQDLSLFKPPRLSRRDVSFD